MELQQMRENKHTFAAKRAKTGGEPARGGGGGGRGEGERDPDGGKGGGGGGGGGKGGGGRPPVAAAKRDAKLLSFGADEDEGG
jgi:hypothetical protein